MPMRPPTEGFFETIDGFKTPCIAENDDSAKGHCLFCSNKTTNETNGDINPSVDTCPARSYYYGILVVLSTSAVANTLRGAIQDKDYTAFVEQLGKKCHWDWAFKKTHPRWKNGLVMTLLYLWTLCRSVSEQIRDQAPPQVVRSAIVCVSEVFGRHKDLALHLLSYLTANDLKIATRQLIRHISMIRLPQTSALGQAAERGKLPISIERQTTFLEGYPANCSAWSEIVEILKGQETTFCLRTNPALLLQWLAATDSIPWDNNNDSTSSSSNLNETNGINAHQIQADSSFRVEIIAMIVLLIYKIFSAGIPVYIRCSRTDNTQRLEDALEASRGLMRAPIVILIPGFDCTANQT